MEDFVTFEIAKKLKEKGFRELCTHCYRNGTFTPQEMFCGLRSNTHHKWSFNSIKVQLKDTHERVQVNIVDAPTISQVLKWLREEKELYIEPCILASADIDADGKVINEFTYWSFRIVSIVTGDMIYFEYKHIDDKRFDSYEQSALAGIEYILDNLI